MIDLVFKKAVSDTYPLDVDLQETTAYFHKNVETKTESYDMDDGIDSTHTYYEYDEATISLSDYYANKSQFENYPN